MRRIQYSVCGHALLDLLHQAVYQLEIEMKHVLNAYRATIVKVQTMLRSYVNLDITVQLKQLI